jgi:hypothetical protein
MRRYIFTERERGLLEDWIESGKEIDDLPRILSWIRQGWPGLADDMELLYKTIDVMMKRKKWRKYMTKGSRFGSASRRAVSALTRARSALSTSGASSG